MYGLGSSDLVRKIPTAIDKIFVSRRAQYRHIWKVSNVSAFIGTLVVLSRRFWFILGVPEAETTITAFTQLDKKFFSAHDGCFFTAAVRACFGLAGKDVSESFKSKFYVG